MTIEDKKPDPFKPQQPLIPGVSGSEQKLPEPQSAGPATSGIQDFVAQLPSRMPPNGILVAIGAALILGMGIAWWTHGSTAKDVDPAPILPAEVSTPEPAKPAEKLPVGPGPIANIDELAKPWASQRFVFHDPATSADAPAIVVHLPGGTNWAFSLREPYGNCELVYLEDAQELRSQYGFRAEHAMVVDPCNKSVFDLAKYGPGPNGLVRGQIVQGPAVRPPIAIETKTKGKQIIALRLE
jgi:hypothetical protein